MSVFVVAIGDAMFTLFGRSGRRGRRVARNSSAAAASAHNARVVRSLSLLLCSFALLLLHSLSLFFHRSITGLHCLQLFSTPAPPPQQLIPSALRSVLFVTVSADRQHSTISLLELFLAPLPSVSSSTSQLKDHFRSSVNRSSLSIDRITSQSFDFPTLLF
jgi:hypothetical protein